MMPVLFRIPFVNIDVPGYGLMMMIGFLCAIAWGARRAARSGANPDVILNCGFVALISGVIGGRLMYVLHNLGEFSNRGGFLSTAWAMIDVRQGGLEYYGGFILAAIAISVWLLWYERVSWRWYADMMAPSVAVGLAFGRLGCYLNGCCFGGPTDLPWAVTFPYASPAQMHYWSERFPGSELPQELMVGLGHKRPEGAPYELSTLLPNGRPAIVISRESIAASNADVAAAQQAEQSARENLAATLQKFPDSDSSSAARRAREQAATQLRLAEADLIDLRAAMRRYNLSAAELRAAAAQHRSIAIHPTQIYSTIMAFIVAGLLSAIYWRRTRDGYVVCALFILEPISRYVLELIRVDNPVDVFGIFTISQFLSLCMIAAATIGLLIVRMLPPRAASVKRWEPPVEEPVGKSASARPA